MTHRNPAYFEQLDAYLDNRLIPDERLAFESKLLREPDLAADLEAERRLRLGLRTRLRPTGAPTSLRLKVQVSLPTTTVDRSSWWTRFTAWLSTPRLVKPYLAVASILVIIILVSGALFLINQRPTAEDHSIFRQLAGKHAAYLKGPALLLDVRGDPADVTGWFADHVPFAVAAPTLADWNLEGGRLGEVHHQPAAHLVYDQAGQHLSLTIFSPQESDFPPSTQTRRGNDDFFVNRDALQPVVLWRINGLGYGLTTDADLSAAELLSLAAALESQLDSQ